MGTATTIFLGIFGGGACVGAFVTLIQFFITRRDNKDSKIDGIAKEIKELRTDIGKIKEELDEDRATNARIRILQFADDVQHCTPKSRESYNQALDDIDHYNKYCNTHENYENSKASAAMEIIETEYQRCLKGEAYFL